MSVRAPRRSNADGLQENVLKAILEKTSSDLSETTKMEDEVWMAAASENERAPQASTTNLKGGGHTMNASFLDITSLSTCSKRSLHSSRLTLSDSKEFYKSIGCRWVRAVRLGDATTVKKMLEDKPELVHYAPTYGPLAIHVATARADKSIIMLLITKGADIDARDGAGYTSLQLAIRLGNPLLAHFLISQGANMEVHDPDGQHITDYDAWTEKDAASAEKSVYGKTILRTKAQSFLGSPSSASGKSIRPTRPSSTPDNSLVYENEKPELKRDGKRSSWKSFFDKTPIGKKFGSGFK